MSDFHNPYHFVPVASESDKSRWKDAAPHRERKSKGAYLEAGHGRYAKGRHHGRVCCTLTTETPIFIGGVRYQAGSEEHLARVAPYELGENPAIPATSLRGMISAIAEAASHSAMRVLDDRALSWRKRPNEALSALGVIKLTKDEDGKTEVRLIPITCPVLHTKELRTQKRDGGLEITGDGEYELPARFSKIFNKDLSLPIKICINGTQDSSGDSLVSHGGRDAGYYYMKIDPMKARETIRSNDSRFAHRSDTKKKIKMLLYRKGFKEQGTLVRAEAGKEYEGMIRGVVRCFEAKVGNKRHQYFIPFSEDHEKKQYPLPVPAPVKKKLELLADERAEADEALPNMPTGRKRWVKKGLSDGDIVFFDVDDAGKISEIAFSAIWRDGPKPRDTEEKKSLATLHDFYDDKELLPFNASRKLLSPAERVFGFVEDRPGGDEKPTESDIAAAYAGHVRFSAAVWDGLLPEGERSPYGPEVTLKILDSPKPPSPALYFRPKSGSKAHENGYIAKHRLNPAEHCPQGRKFYLHKYEKDKKPWETHPANERDRLKQKVRITPLVPKLTFGFHIDFDNLDDYELGMLLYALCPNDDFHHKIGMGKPLGLGSVRLNIVSLHTLDRVARYRDQDPFSPSRDETACDWKQYRDAFRAEAHGNSKAAIEALELLGDRSNVTCQVRYPQVSSVNKNPLTTQEEEVENFRWWVANDHGAKSRYKVVKNGRPVPEHIVEPQKQSLQPLDESNGLIPLHKNPFAK